MHGVPTKYTPGQIRQWIEEDNKGNVLIMGIRWLLKECRRGEKLASSLVIHSKDEIDINQGLRMGRKVFRTTRYEWER